MGSRFDGGRGPPDIEGMTSLKVDNLTYRTSMDDLERYFRKYGEVGDIYIPRDRNTHESRGFAFIRYYEKRDADDAMDGMDGKLIDGREIRVALARYGRPTTQQNPRQYGGRGGGGGGYRDRGGYSNDRNRNRGNYSERRHSPRRRSRSRSNSPRRRARSRSRSPRYHKRSLSLSRSPIRPSKSPQKGLSRSRSRSRSRTRSRSISGARII